MNRWLRMAVWLVPVFAIVFSIWLGVGWIAHERAPPATEGPLTKAQTRSVPQSAVQVDPAPPDPAPDSVADDALDRETQAKALFGWRWRRYLSIKSRFETYYERSLNGEPVAVFEILQVTRDCQNTQGLHTQESIDELRLSYPPSASLDYLFDSIEFLQDECSIVWSQVPIDNSYWDFRLALVDKAVQQGSATARLMQLASYRWRQQTGAVPEPFERVSHLLNEALRTEDYRAYQEARDLFNRFKNQFGRGSDMQIAFWNFAICHHDPFCDFEMFQASDDYFFTHESATIIRAISLFDRRLQREEPIDFQQMFTEPLQRPDGSMWFED